MPQLQLPIFPAGVTEINSQIAVQKEAGRVFYLHGHLPVFQHEEQDVRSFRMFTSQMIAGGTVKPKEIVKTFGVPMVTVKRYVKVYRDRGSKGFYAAQPRHSSASVLKGPVLEQAQQLLDEGAERAGSGGGTERVAEHSAQGDPRGPFTRSSKKSDRGATPSNQPERTQPDRQPGADGQRRDAIAGTRGGGDGRTGVGADRVSPPPAT